MDEEKKLMMLKFFVNWIVAFILWPVLNWLFTFIDGSTFTFNFGRNCWVATGFAVMFGIIIPMVTGKKKGE